MSIASEITALTEKVTQLDTIRTSMRTKLASKGVSANDHDFADFPSDVESIQTGGGSTDSSVYITDYNTTTGIITGNNFGTASGSVWLLDRDTHTYISQTVSSWNDKSITLQSPIDRSAIQGNSCFYVRTSDNRNSHKYMVYGDGTLTVPQYGLVYLKNIDGTISKITMTASTNVTSSLCGDTGYGKTVTINNVSLNTGNIVGVQFGDSVSSYTISNNFLGGLISLNQPVVIPSNITVNGKTNFMINCYQFDCPVIFHSGVTNFGNGFMSYCTSFNQPIDVSMLTSLAQTGFLRYNYSFNQKIKLPTTLDSSVSGGTNIGNYFLGSCCSYNQDIKLPTNTTKINTYFLSECCSFNSKIDLPSTLTEVSNYFMSNCYSFNYPLDISHFTTIGTYFMNSCYSFNQELDISNLTTISNYFMNSDYSFNQALDTSDITTIGTYFMSTCNTFNQELDISKVTSIGQNFLYGCRSFNSDVTLNTNLKTIPENFIQNCYAFNKYIDFSNIESFGGNFLQGCISFNQTINLSSAKTIGNTFMSGCNSFNKSITLPSTVTSVGTSFLNGVYPSLSITVNTTASPTDTGSLASSSNKNSAYLIGHTIYGTGRSTWLTNLPNRTSSPYRKLVNGGS